MSPWRAPKPGTYGCVPGRVQRGNWHTIQDWIFSFLICWGTRSRYSHVVITRDETTVFEATPLGFLISPIAKFLHKPGMVWNDEEPIPDEVRARIVGRLEAFAAQHVRYDFVNILDFAFRCLGLPFRVDRTAGSGRTICSVAAVRGYAPDIDLTLDCNGVQCDEQGVSPGDLADRITRRAWEEAV